MNVKNAMRRLRTSGQWPKRRERKLGPRGVPFGRTIYERKIAGGYVLYLNPTKGWGLRLA